MELKELPQYTNCRPPSRLQIFLLAIPPVSFDIAPDVSCTELRQKIMQKFFEVSLDSGLCFPRNRGWSCGVSTPKNKEPRNEKFNFWSFGLAC